MFEILNNKENPGKQITNSEEKITPFGGFNFCHKLFNDCGLPQLIDSHWGKRVKAFGFDYSDIFSNHWPYSFMVETVPRMSMNTFGSISTW